MINDKDFNKIDAYFIRNIRINSGDFGKKNMFLSNNLFTRIWAFHLHQFCMYR